MAIDLTLDAATAARRLLVEAVANNPEDFPVLDALLGRDDVYDDGWIFRWRPYISVEGTGKAAVVLSQRPGQGANVGNTMRFPRLQVEIYVDTPRSAGGQPTSAASAEDACHKIFLELDRYLHLVDGHVHMWSELRVLRSTRGTDIDITDVPDADGMVRGLVSYDLSLG